MNFDADSLLKLIGKQYVMIEALQQALKEERAKHTSAHSGTSATPPAPDRAAS